jgi:hypothetical protein
VQAMASSQATTSEAMTSSVVTEDHG